MAFKTILSDSWWVVLELVPSSWGGGGRIQATPTIEFLILVPIRGSFQHHYWEHYGSLSWSIQFLDLALRSILSDISAGETQTAGRTLPISHGPLVTWRNKHTGYSCFIVTAEWQLWQSETVRLSCTRIQLDWIEINFPLEASCLRVYCLETILRSWHKGVL